MKKSEYLDQIKSITAFQSIAERDMALLLNLAQEQLYSEGESLYESGDVLPHIGLLVSGAARFNSDGQEDAPPYRVGLSKNDFFGVLSLINEAPVHYTLLCQQDCAVLLWSQNEFLDILEKYPEALSFLIKLDESLHEKLTAQNPGVKISWLKSYYKTEKLVEQAADAGIHRFLLVYHDFHRIHGIIKPLGDKGDHHFNIEKRGKQWILQSERSTEIMGDSSEILLADFLKTIDSSVEWGRGDLAVHFIMDQGSFFQGPQVYSDQWTKSLRCLAKENSRTNPVHHQLIERLSLLFKGMTQVLSFGSSLYRSLPEYASQLLPLELYGPLAALGRKGYMGQYHLQAAFEGAGFLRRSPGQLEILSCFLDYPVSCCALDHGRAVDVSSSYSPESGGLSLRGWKDLDPTFILDLLESQQWQSDDLAQWLEQSGPLTSVLNPESAVPWNEEALYQSPKAMAALKRLAYDIRKQIGAMAAAMGGLDVVVLSGRAACESPLLRSLIFRGLQWLGLSLNYQANREYLPEKGIAQISQKDSPVKLLLVPLEPWKGLLKEALHCLSMARSEKKLKKAAPLFIPIEVSAHHIHLSREHVEQLFGNNYSLTPKAELSQPGQFACQETLVLQGPKGQIPRVRILGPERKQTQVEIAMTEQFKLGIHPPIRESGDLAGSPGLTLIGPEGEVELTQGVICAMRHIHMTPEDALSLGLKDRDIVQVKVGGDRELVFGDVLVRVKSSYRLAMHIDTDEGNAANLKTGDKAYILGIQNRE